MGQPKKSSATTFASTTFVGPWDGQKEEAATVLNTHIQFSFIQSHNGVDWVPQKPLRTNGSSFSAGPKPFHVKYMSRILSVLFR